MSRSVRIVAVQMPFGTYVAKNLAAMTAAVKRLARRSVDLAVFPECCLSDYVVAPKDRDWRAIDAGVEAMRELARARRMAIIFGTAERNGRKKPFNSTFALDMGGDVGIYAHVRPAEHYAPGRSEKHEGHSYQGQGEEDVFELQLPYPHDSFPGNCCQRGTDRSHQHDQPRQAVEGGQGEGKSRDGYDARSQGSGQKKPGAAVQNLFPAPQQ